MSRGAARALAGAPDALYGAMMRVLRVAFVAGAVACSGSGQVATTGGSTSAGGGAASSAGEQNAWSDASVSPQQNAWSDAGASPQQNAWADAAPPRGGW